MQASTKDEGRSSDPQSVRKRGRTKALFKGSALATDDGRLDLFVSDTKVDATRDGLRG
jgi:hypothetical protein